MSLQVIKTKTLMETKKFIFNACIAGESGGVSPAPGFPAGSASPYFFYILGLPNAGSFF
jgi:hypothetical protein